MDLVFEDSTKHQEKLQKDALRQEDYDSLRRAAECHRQVRKHAQKFIKPGMRLIDICNEIEQTNRTLMGYDPQKPLEAGIAFPTGCSINNCAAHYTPNLGDETVLQKGDVMKIDYGSHVNGLMTDCAFTWCIDPTFDNLIMAVKDATETGVKNAGIDVRVADVGAAIVEVMESYEVEIQNKVWPVKSIKNLNGHNMLRWRIHAGTQVPIYDNGSQKKMMEGEQYAIETFGSTGKGHVD